MDILIILGLIFVNGIFAMSELAIVSARRVRLQALAENGSRGAKTAIELAESPSRFLSTIQVGITLIGISMGALGEASLASRLTPVLAGVPWIGTFANEIALGVVVIVITFASLIFGELVPKRIAMQYPESVASFISKPMKGLSRAMGPFVRVLSVSTDSILRLLGLHSRKEGAVTEEDITGMLREGTEAGLLEKTEHEIVSRAMRLDDQRVGGLMTPRMDVHYIDLDDPLETTLLKIADSPYTRFPVCKGGLGNIIGIVHAGNLFDQTIRGQPIEIAAASKEPLFVPETISAMQLLETFKKSRAELALVVDEYGELEGVATLSDVLGALVGDVAVLDEQQEADGVRRDDGSWLLDGGMSFDRFRELLQTDVAFPEENAGTYHTLAGFVLAVLGHIPQAAEHFDWEGFSFEVVDMDRNRIDRLLVRKIAED